MMMEMITPIAIDEEIFGPKITMIIGPSATFGMAFRTTRYGSSTRARSGIHQRKVAIMAPSTVPRMKPTPVSSNVVHMWTQSEPSIHLLRKRSQMLEGELKSKGSIHSFLLAISHSAKKRMSSKSCKERANHARLRSCFRNCSCSCFILSKSLQLLPYILEEGWEVMVVA